MSVLLKDERELKGLVNGELQTIARWKDTGGTEKIIALSKIKKDMPEIYEYLSYASTSCDLLQGEQTQDG